YTTLFRCRGRSRRERGPRRSVSYLDASCLLKLLLEEPESEAVRMAVAGESEVIVSALTELETAVRLRAGWLGGEYRERRYRAYVGRLNVFRDTDPFRFRPLARSEERRVGKEWRTRGSITRPAKTTM